jgi:hypothetical protein
LATKTKALPFVASGLTMFADYAKINPSKRHNQTNEGVLEMSNSSSLEIHAAVVAQKAAEIFIPRMVSKASMTGYAMAIGAYGKKASFQGYASRELALMEDSLKSTK